MVNYRIVLNLSNLNYVILDDFTFDSIKIRNQFTSNNYNKIFGKR